MADKKRVKKHRCRVCGVYGVTHIHHIFGGARRRISDKYDFVIELCPVCHEKAHNDASFGNALKHDCQLQYMEDYSMEEWMDLMGRSWIDEGELAKEPRNPHNSDIFDD